MVHNPWILHPPGSPGSLFAEESGEKGSGQDLSDKYRNPPLVPKRPRSVDSSRNRAIIATSAIAIVAIVIVCGMYFFAPGLIAQTVVPIPPAITPVAVSPPAPVHTELPTPALTLQPAPTTGIITVPTTVQRVVPKTGVWVRINYSGNFSGSVGTAGGMRNVASSGDKIYQIPARDEVVEATIQKLDNSGNILTVEVYSDGILIKSGTTRTPEGEVDVHADLKTAELVAANRSDST